MRNIVLKLPKNIYENEANELKKEFFSNNEKVINGSSLLDKMDYKEWLDFNERNRKEETVASSKTITKCGGKLTESKLYLDGKPMQIYWISIK